MSKEIVSSQILQSLSDAIAAVAEKVAPAVVRVGSGHSIGSGVVWSADGHIVTCNHVVDKLSVVDVGLPDGRSSRAKVMGLDPYSDVALLKIDKNNLNAIELHGVESLRAGQFVLAFANSLGQRPSVTSGIVTNPQASVRGWWGTTLENVVVTDARLNPGYSGGPLVDASGRMVGLNAAYIASRGIAIPARTAKSVTDKLAREGRIRRAYLGLVSNVIALPKEISTQPQINQDEGLIVLKVEPDSPAKRAGLWIGDVIVKFDQKPVKNHFDLHGLLNDKVIGKPTSLWILRGERPTELEIQPAEAQG